MKDNSALILGDHRAGLIAGLDWQLVSGADTRTQIREIRRQAAENGARACVRIGRTHHAGAGFYAWEPDLAGETRPARLYSFAALLSHRLHPSHAVVAWRITQGPHAGLVAVVVLEDHLPVADLVLPLAQARAAVNRFRRAHDSAHPDGLWSNDLQEFPEAQPMILDWPELKPGRHERIRAIPSDPLGVGATLLAGALLASGLLVFTEYEAHHDRAKAAASTASVEQARAYDAALQAVRPQLGADSAAVIRLLDGWMDHPAVLASWALSDVDCTASQCMQTWQSEGGYTASLIKALQDYPDQTPVHDLGNTQRLQVKTPQHLGISGVSAFDELPDAQSLQRLLFDEQQVWKKARMTHRLDIEGTTWPPGPPPASGQHTLKRHAFNVTAPLDIVRGMLQDYAGLVWWERLHLHVKPFEAQDVLLVELQGAFYAY